MGDFLIPLDGPDLVDGLDVWRQPAMYTQHALVYDLHAHTNTLSSEITSHYLNGSQAFSCWTMTSWVAEWFSASVSSAVAFMQNDIFFRLLHFSTTKCQLFPATAPIYSASLIVTEKRKDTHKP